MVILHEILNYSRNADDTEACALWGWNDQEEFFSVNPLSVILLKAQHSVNAPSKYLGCIAM